MGEEPLPSEGIFGSASASLVRICMTVEPWLIKVSLHLSAFGTSETRLIEMLIT